jgi:Ca-activated chloride channel family protein
MPNRRSCFYLIFSEPGPEYVVQYSVMKKSVFFLVLFLGLVASGMADGLIIIHNPPPWHPPHPPPPHWRPPVYQFAPLEVVYHHVNVKIDGQVAHTDIDQEFFNPNNQRLEGTYLFPIPKGAQLDKFSMEIDGKQVEAELLPADKARSIYEDIVRKMKDPALLEYADRDTFKVRIFPIEPRAKKQIKLAYTQVLKADDGLVGYLYPLNTEKFSSAPIKSVSVKVELEARQSIKSVYSPSHEVEIKRHGDQRVTIGFEGKDIKPDTDFQVFWQVSNKEVAVNLMSYRETDKDGYFLLFASPGADTRASKEVMPKDVAFVLDTSGSMAGKKLDQAKKALRFCVENLNDQDRFEIIRFSTETENLFEQLEPVTKANRRKATEFVDGLKPIGGTAIEEALLKALALRPAKPDHPYLIIFLTDGQPTIGNTREPDILAAVKKADPGQTRVFCFGIGTDVNTHLLDKITEQTRAVSQYVLPEEDIEIKVSNFYTKIKEPVLANPTLTFTGAVKVNTLYPSPLPDLFRGDQLVVVGRYKGDGAAAAVIEGTVDGKPRKIAWDVSFAARARENEFIPRLWAMRRIGFLLDEIRLRGENRELRDEVAQLAREYGIVTPYTSFLIVEDEKHRDVPVPLRTMRQVEEDREVSEQAAAAYDVLRGDKSGAGSVAGARAKESLKNVPAPSALLGGQGYARQENARAFADARPTTGEVTERFDQYSQQTRYVNGRAFYQNGDQWVDSRVQQLPNARRVQVKFNSDEYFDLIARHREAAPWLSVARNVQFVLDDTVYEIVD